MSHEPVPSSVQPQWRNLAAVVSAVAAEPGCCDAGASRRVAPPPNRKLPACRTADAVASWGEMRQDGEHVAWWW